MPIVQSDNVATRPLAQRGRLVHDVRRKKESYLGEYVLEYKICGF